MDTHSLDAIFFLQVTVGISDFIFFSFCSFQFQCTRSQWDQSSRVSYWPYSATVTWQPESCASATRSKGSLGRLSWVTWTRPLCSTSPTAWVLATNCCIVIRWICTAARMAIVCVRSAHPTGKWVPAASITSLGMNTIRSRWVYSSFNNTPALTESPKPTWSI